MTKKKLKICLDLDEVVFGFMDQFLRFHNLRNDTRVTKADITQFMPHESLKELITAQAWEESFKWFETHGGYATTPSLEGARTAIEALIREGHEITYVTARHPDFKGTTEMAFILNKIPNKENVYYEPNGKTERLKQLAPDIFVDDSIKNCKQGDEAGIKKIFVMDAPYNRMEAGFERIYNLIQLERMLVEED